MSNNIFKNSSDSKQQLACLYTKHKTQKRKIWQDGRLVLNTKSLRAVLHDADPPLGSGDPSLGECEIAAGQLQVILQQYHDGNNNNNNNNNNDNTATTIETERYLIEIEGPWTNNVSKSTPSTVPISKRLSKGKKMMSSSMKKLLTSKFQKPKVYVPPPPGIQNSRAEQVLGKRRRPLQPGELVAKHYGGGGNSVGDSRGGFDDRRNSYDHQHQQDQRRDSHQQRSHSQIGENNGTRPPPLRPDLQRYGQQQQQQQQQRSLPHEQPADRMKASFQTLEEPNSLILSGRAEGCLSVGPAAMRPQSTNAQRQSHRNLVQQRKHNTSSFVQNEFDSARYYGIEGEEEEDEEELTASSQASLAVAHAQQNDNKNNHIHKDPCNNRRNSTTSEVLDEGTIQTMDNIHQEGEKRLGKQQNQNHYQSFPSSLKTLNRHSKYENDNKISNNINNDSRSISKVHLVEQQSKLNNKVELCLADRDRHLEKVQEEDEEESESEDDEFSENDDDAPSSFRLKPIKSFTDANKNTRAPAMPCSVSGNHLLTLFGAGANKQAYRNTDNAAMISENNFDKKIDESDDDVKNDKRKNDEKEGKEGKDKQRGNGSSISGFYLTAAATSSEESSDEDDGDEE